LTGQLAAVEGTHDLNLLSSSCSSSSRRCPAPSGLASRMSFGAVRSRVGAFWCHSGSFERIDFLKTAKALSDATLKAEPGQALVSKSIQTPTFTGSSGWSRGTTAYWSSSQLTAGGCWVRLTHLCSSCRNCCSGCLWRSDGSLRAKCVRLQAPCASASPACWAGCGWALRSGPCCTSS